MTTIKDAFLAHAAKQPYDPAARRERYLLERKLKGREPGSSDITKGDTPVEVNKGGAKLVKGATPTTVDKAAPKPPGTPITPQRVAEMKVRLEELKKLLTRLTEEANKKAGVETPEKTADKTAAEKKADSKPAEKKTAAEKKDAAKAAEKARAKEGGTNKSSDTVNSLQTQLNQVHDKIAAMRDKIAAMTKTTAATKTPPKPKDKKDTKSKPEEDKKSPQAVVTRT